MGLTACVAWLQQAPPDLVNNRVAVRALQGLRDAYENYRENGTLPASYEIIYGHAWKALTAERPRSADEVQVQLKPGF